MKGLCYRLHIKDWDIRNAGAMMTEQSLLLAPRHALFMSAYTSISQTGPAMFYRDLLFEQHDRHKDRFQQYIDWMILLV